MTRYKGSHSAKAVERDYPHFVDVAVPPGGLGSRLDAMYAFHERTASGRSAGTDGTTLTVASCDGASLIRL
ncbi:MAG: hypothetical protein WBD15_12700, partial [Pseudolabrys sp.]